jgi:biopolymer transport protein ExbD
MSGGGVDQPQKQQKGKGGRRKKRRINVKIDMTPMVDIVMLLLIFYMVTTVFSMPQAMEINLPPEDDQIILEVKETNLLTIRVDGENRFFWNIGRVGTNMPQLIPSARLAGDTLGFQVEADSLRSILVNENRNNPNLSTLVLIRKDAKYNAMVDILDEIDILERSWNAVKARELDKEVNELTKEERFSYRYAIGEWEDKDDRIVADALQNALGGGEVEGE